MQLPFPLRRALALSLLPALMAPQVANAAASRKASGPRATKVVAPNNAIIPLPLTPIVPVAQRLCAAKTASGLGYTVLRQSAGAKPAPGETVTINYLGYLAATGAVFDQSTEASLPVDGVIAGFSEGLRMLAPHGVVRLCIPAALGYGARATGPIPANADLVFQVELLDAKPSGQ